MVGGASAFNWGEEVVVAGLRTVGILTIGVVLCSPIFAGAQVLEVFESRKISMDVAGALFGNSMAARGRRATVSLNDGRAVWNFYREDDRQWAHTSSWINNFVDPLPDDLSMGPGRMVRILPQAVGIATWPDSSRHPNSSDWYYDFPDDVEAVSVYSTRIAVGRPHYGTAGVAQVWVLTLRGDWVLEQNFIGYGTDGENFGAAVHLEGTMLVIGAPRTDAGGYGIAGVFERSGGQWNFLNWMWSPVVDYGNGYGSAVAVSGDLLVIGSPRQNRTIVPYAVDAGAVYVYRRQAGARGIVTYELQDQFFGLNAYDHFGASLDLTDTALVVGAPGADRGPAGNAGSVFVYRRFDWILHPVALLHASVAEAHSDLGASVALSASDVLAGAPGAEGPGGEIDAGAVYVWYGMGSVFYDGFESGDTTAWSGTSGG